MGEAMSATVPARCQRGTRRVHKATGEIWRVVRPLSGERVLIETEASEPVSRRGRSVSFAYWLDENRWGAPATRRRPEV